MFKINILAVSTYEEENCFKLEKFYNFPFVCFNIKMTFWVFMATGEVSMLRDCKPPFMSVIQAHLFCISNIEISSYVGGKNVLFFPTFDLSYSIVVHSSQSCYHFKTYFDSLPARHLKLLLDFFFNVAMWNPDYIWSSSRIPSINNLGYIISSHF